MNKEQIISTVEEMVRVIKESGSVISYDHILKELQQAIPDGHDIYYVVTYDNGSGYREWACTPQPTKERAWHISSMSPGFMDAQIEEVPVNTIPKSGVFKVSQGNISWNPR